jgi:hypothetical protein
VGRVRLIRILFAGIWIACSLIALPSGAAPSIAAGPPSFVLGASGGVDAHHNLPAVLTGPAGSPATTSTAGTSPTTISSINFDGQPTGVPQTGSGSSQFSGIAGGASLSVESSVAQSKPNGLSIAVTGGHSTYGYGQYAGGGYASHTLQFSVELGSDFVLPSAGYLVLAQTLSQGSSTSAAGKVSLILAGGNLRLHLDYVDSSGTQRYLWSSAALTPGGWHTIAIQDTAGGSGSGALSLSVDGKVAGSATGIDTGGSPVGYFAVGEEYSPSDSKIAGHLYLDDVATSTLTATSTSTIASINFDRQSTGVPQTGTSSSQFSGIAGAANLTVESSVAQSQPNGLGVAMTGGSGSYGYVRYAGGGYSSHMLQFSIELGSDFVLPSADYLVLAQTLPQGSSGSSAGKVSLIMTGGTLGLHLDYIDSSGTQRYLWSSAGLTPGGWYTIAIQDTVGGSGSGALSFSVDGKVAGSATGIDTGTSPVGYFAVGDEFSPSDPNIGGHFYLDDVVTASSATAPPESNPIRAENQLPGTTGWVITKPADSHQIEGYATSTSVAAGSYLSFAVSTTSPSFTADGYRMGWYGGAGGRLIESLPSMVGVSYAIPQPDSTTGLVAPSWPLSFSLGIPASMVSGVYMVKLTASSGYQSYIPFTVTDTRASPLIFIHAVATDEAYNDWGGKSLYGDDAYPYGSSDWSAHRAYKVTYERPFSYGEDAGAGLFFHWEYPMVRWLERNGYDVSYTTDVAVDEDSSQLLRHHGIIMAGHDEYWTGNVFSGCSRPSGRESTWRSSVETPRYGRSAMSLRAQIRTGLRFVIVTRHSIRCTGLITRSSRRDGTRRRFPGRQASSWARVAPTPLRGRSILPLPGSFQMPRAGSSPEPVSRTGPVFPDSSVMSMTGRFPPCLIPLKQTSWRRRRLRTSAAARTSRNRQCTPPAAGRRWCISARSTGPGGSTTTITALFSSPTAPAPRSPARRRKRLLPTSWWRWRNSQD